MTLNAAKPCHRIRFATQLARYMRWVHTGRVHRRGGGRSREAVLAARNLPRRSLRVGSGSQRRRVSAGRPWAALVVGGARTMRPCRCWEGRLLTGHLSRQSAQNQRPARFERAVLGRASKAQLHDTPSAAPRFQSTIGESALLSRSHENCSSG